MQTTFHFYLKKEDHNLAKATKEDFKTAVLAVLLKLNTVWLIVDYFTIYKHPSQKSISTPRTMSPNRSHNHRRHQNGRTHRTQRNVSASGTGGGSAAPKSSFAASLNSKNRKSVTSKSEKRKQKKTELSWMEIVEKWKDGHLANLINILGSHSR